MNRRLFLKRFPLLTAMGIMTLSAITKEAYLSEGYITPKAKKLRKEMDKELPYHPTPEQSEQMLDELLDNCNPTKDQFNVMFDRCVVSGRVLYRLSADGFRMKG